MQRVIRMFYDENGRIILSAILGLGFASMFYQVCKKDNCLIIKLPPDAELQKYYKIGNDCYKYKKIDINCPQN